MRIIGGKFRGKKLLSPLTPSTRPTADRARESIFNILEHRYHFKVSGKRILDLFAGTGALGIEALSRGASFALFVENNPDALESLKKNLENFSQAHVSSQNVLDLRSTFDQSPFDLIFMDPPYFKNLICPTLEKMAQNSWRTKNTIFVIETGLREAIDFPVNFHLIGEEIYGAAKITFGHFY